MTGHCLILPIQWDMPVLMFVQLTTCSTISLKMSSQSTCHNDLCCQIFQHLCSDVNMVSRFFSQFGKMCTDYILCSTGTYGLSFLMFWCLCLTSTYVKWWSIFFYYLDLDVCRTCVFHENISNVLILFLFIIQCQAYLFAITADLFMLQKPWSSFSTTHILGTFCFFP